MTSINKQIAPREPERNINQKKSGDKEIIELKDLEKLVKFDQDAFCKVLKKEAAKLPDHSMFKKILLEVYETVSKAVTQTDYQKAANAIMKTLSKKDDKAVIYSLKQEIKEIIKRKMNRPRLESKSFDPKLLEPEVKEVKEYTKKSSIDPKLLEPEVKKFYHYEKKTSSISNKDYVQLNLRTKLNPNAPAPDKQVDQMITYLEKKGAKLIFGSTISYTRPVNETDHRRYAINGKITKDSYINQRVKELKRQYYQSAMDQFSKMPVKNANVKQASAMIRKAENKADLRAEAKKEFLELLEKKDTIVKDSKISLKEYLNSKPSSPKLRATDSIGPELRDFNNIEPRKDLKDF